MKKIIKKIFPESLLDFLRKKRTMQHINKLYRFDKKRLQKYAYSINNDFTADNLRSKITFHYHAIEKGLSNANLRLGFGERAFNQLFWAMDEYINKGYPSNDSRFQQAISVIDSYVELHKKENFDVSLVERKQLEYKNYNNGCHDLSGGYIEMNRSNLPKFSSLSFNEIAASRYSVRDFGTEDIGDESIFNAINIATKSPSVCNRQAWQVRYVKSPDVVKKVLKIQGGLSGNGENLNKLLLVTADKQYMNGGHERNQTYIDGGLYTMSLLYALTYLNIASCTLNTNFTLKKELDMRELLGIRESEDLIAFIAIGSYPENLKVAKSPRDDYTQFTTVI